VSEKSKYYIGATFPTNQGQTVKIIAEELSKSSAKRFRVQFQDDFKHEATYSQVTISQGRMKNPYFPSIAGVGYLGVGEFKRSQSGKNTKAYDAWANMINRCYKEGYKDHDAYKDIEVCEEWKCFQNYASWFEANCIKGWEPDKDILDPYALEYSPETVMFVPPAYNKKFQRKRVKEDGLLEGVKKKPSGGYSVHLQLFESQKGSLSLSKKEDANYVSSVIRILGVIETFSNDPMITPEAKGMIVGRLLEQYTILKHLKAEPRVIEQ
jgi:hypothetical protein